MGTLHWPLTPRGIKRRDGEVADYIWGDRVPDLNVQLFYYLKKLHVGKDRAVTVREIAYDLKSTDREIRRALRRLNLKGHPIVTSIHYPFGVFICQSEEEINEYLSNLGSRASAIHERMRALSKIKTREFLRGQLELFE